MRMAKADDVQLIVRYALEGDDEKVRAAVKLLASHEREAGRSGVTRPAWAGWRQHAPDQG